MRLRVMEVEGTPEEFGRLDIEHLLGRPLAASASRIELSGDQVPPVSHRAQLDAILDAEAPPGRSRQLLGEFFDTVLSWGDVTVVPSWRPNRPSKVSYLRVHRHPRTAGAFVYVFPPRLRMNFRLDGAAAKDSPTAVRRDVKADNAYQVTLTLTDESGLAEACRLARSAYDTTCLIAV